MPSLKLEFVEMVIVVAIVLAIINTILPFALTQSPPQARENAWVITIPCDIGVGLLGTFIVVDDYRKEKAQRQMALDEQERKIREEEDRKRDAERAEAQAKEFEIARQKEIERKIANAGNLVKAGRYEEAAQTYEALGDWEKAGECRRMNRTTYVVSADLHIGKDGGIRVDCPHCGASQPIKSRETNEVTCAYCNKKYIIPEKVLKLL